MRGEGGLWKAKDAAQSPWRGPGTSRRGPWLRPSAARRAVCLQKRRKGGWLHGVYGRERTAPSSCGVERRGTKSPCPECPCRLAFQKTRPASSWRGARVQMASTLLSNRNLSSDKTYHRAIRPRPLGPPRPTDREPSIHFNSPIYRWNKGDSERGGVLLGRMAPHP